MLQNVPTPERAVRSAAEQDAPNPSFTLPRAPRWIDRLSVAQKLGLAGALFFVPLVVNVTAAASTLMRIVQPVAGAEQIMPFVNATTDLQRALDDLTLAASAQTSPAAARQRAEQALTQLGALLDSEASTNPISPLPEIRRELRQTLQFANFRAQVERYLALPPSGDRVSSYGTVNSAVQNVLKNITQASSLDLGGGQHTMYLLQRAALGDGLMGLRSNLVQAELLNDRLRRGAPNASADRTRLSALVTQMSTEVGQTQEALNDAVRERPEQARALSSEMQQLSNMMSLVLGSLRAAASGAGGSTSQALIDRNLQQIDRLYAQTSAALSQEGKNFQDEYVRNGIVNGLITLLITALATWLLVYILQRIVRQLRQLTDNAQALTAGNLNVHLPVTTSDELGVLTHSFNAAASELRANAARMEQERHEAQQLQNNIGQFLDVTMDIAEGDLTKRGKVTEDVLGNVVDSINLMTEELAATLRQVQDASASVSGGSRQMLGTTEAIQQGAQLTASEAQRVAEQVRLITATIREMAHNAQTSAQTAREALLASQQGQEALQETLGGMQNIRREVQQVSRRIKTLGDRSLEIQEIVDTISQIARRTNLLALNASVEAAGAGDVGGRFGAVADEIRQLAATSAQATTRIAGLIRSVQAEVQDVIVGAEEGTREVEQGYRIAGSAGQRLQDIGQLTERSAQLAEQIAASTQAQVSSVEQVNAAVQQIAEVAQRSESAVEQGRSAAQRLEDLAQQLNASLARFRLPG